MAEYKPEHVQAIARAWRNRFISERTSHLMLRHGYEYEQAIATAETDANAFESAFIKLEEARDGSR